MRRGGLNVHPALLLIGQSRLFFFVFGVLLTNHIAYDLSINQRQTPPFPVDPSQQVVLAKTVLGPPLPR